MSTAPLLSIGMIFKNEARCLERCLQSLQPLREAIPCELVMADTGATDGSREIAEKYADCVFDFAWVNDFAAARNAVMDRCRGKWYFSVDCDEWLDADISELQTFLTGNSTSGFAFIVIRNYYELKLEQTDNYSAFRALRLARMDTGARYHGAIHESLIFKEPAAQLSGTVLHHDGYAFVDPAAKKKKQQRNMTLLYEKLEKAPEDLLTLIQCIESSGEEMDPMQYVRRAVDIVQKKQGQWERFGGYVMYHAVHEAYRHELPEYENWLRYAEQHFSQSVFVKVDVNYSAFLAAHNAKEWEKAIRYGEAYRKGLQALHSPRPSKKVLSELETGTVHFGHPTAERTLLVGLADAYFQNAQAETALEILASLDSTKLSLEQVPITTVALCQLHTQSTLDIGSVLIDFYDQIARPAPDKQKQTARLAAFDTIATASFTADYREEEQQKDNYHRPAFTAFACLADRCEAGRGAKILLTDDATEIASWLQKVEDWQALPIEALEHALDAGVPFPLPDKPLPQEVLDGLAARLTHDENRARQLILSLPDEQEYSNMQQLAWAQSLALAALRSFDWTLGKNQAPVSKFYCPDKKKDQKLDRRPPDTPETGLALVRRFAALESAALPLLYAPALLCEENAALLPPMHRWGFYCAGALRELDAGRPQAYLAALRRGLTACPGEKEMVQFLLDRFMEDARPAADPELLALADRVRAILAAYAPDDPAVAAIRQSPAYQQVAWLIETPSAAPAASALPANVIVAPLPQ